MFKEEPSYESRNSGATSKASPIGYEKKSFAGDYAKRFVPQYVFIGDDKSESNMRSYDNLDIDLNRASSDYLPLRRIVDPSSHDLSMSPY